LPQSNVRPSVTIPVAAEIEDQVPVVDYTVTFIFKHF
jgi:hypothetical protein